MPVTDDSQKLRCSTSSDENDTRGSVNVPDSKERNEAVKRVNYLESILEKQAAEIEVLKHNISRLQANNTAAQEDQHWDVEDILDMRRRNDSTREFLIRWKGFPPSWDTWEPESHLNCDEKLATFFQMQTNNGELLGDDSDGNSNESNSHGDGKFDEGDEGGEGVNDDNDDDDKDYKLQCVVIEKGGRKSSRTSKPPDTLNYKNKPSCFQCGRTARNVVLPDSLGAIFCTIRCSRIWESKIKKI